ncbi:MAG: PQQ-binding-like beta-propeller repeat protein [Spirochaetales bacterium]|nr:PQQ-binding-like beta-propeller repeat protein [Spirochaetales bacterium]
MFGFGCGSRHAGDGSHGMVALIASLALAASAYGQGVGQAADAEILFRFPVGGVTSAGPVVGNGLLWLLSDSKTLYVLTLDGVAIGKTVLEQRRLPFIATDRYGRAVISSGETGLAMVNRSGREVWRVEVGAAPATPPVFGPDGRLYVVAGGTLYAYAPNGKKLWMTTLGDALGTGVVIGPGGGPAVGLVDGRVLLYSPDGVESMPLNTSSPLVALGAGPDGLIAAMADGSLSIIGDTIAVPVAARMAARPLAVAASADGYYALDASGSIVALDTNGTERWRTQTKMDSALSGFVAFSERLVLITRSSVRSFGPDGSPYRTLALRNTVSTPAIAPTGTVFAGGADWILYAYRFEKAFTMASTFSVPGIDLDAVDAVAREEARWSSGSSTDDATMMRLVDIEKSIESGTISGETTRTMLYLAAVASGRMEAPFGMGALKPGPMPGGALPRARACELLGRLGLPQAVPILVDVFKDDADEAVRVAAARALATIGIDPEGEAFVAFAAAAATRLDDRSARAVVSAIEGLYRSSGALDDRSGVLALMRIAGGTYPRDVLDAAERALRSLSWAR